MSCVRCLVFVPLVAQMSGITPARASAQERQLGLKVGASMATLDAETSPATAPFDVRTGLTGGAFAVIPIKGRLALQVEILFTDKGGEQPLDDPSLIQGSSAFRLLFQYLDVPVLGRVSGPRVGRARLHAFTGPTFSTRLKASSQLAFSGVGSFGVEEDIGRDVRRFDVGLTVGGGAEAGRLGFDARYTFGTTEVFKQAAGPAVKHRGFLVTVGYRIF